jgi:HD-GYP domain-containing protein (c-di-GMP phosphodiesterase class II)
VEAYDAITHSRPSRPAYSDEEAVERLKQEAGAQFDPHVLGVFIDLLATVRRVG